MVELITNDRVIGGLTTAAAEQARDVYATFCSGDLLLTNAVTAELTKLAENSFRDVNIAFANELSLVADRLGVDVWELIGLANHHPRVNILRPGPGVGGHCIAVDPWFIVDAAPDLTPLIRTAREVNDAKPAWVVGRTVAAVAGKTNPKIAALGLAFKADVDDLRESPAVEVVAELARRLPDAAILAVEPHVTALPPALAGLENVALADVKTALADADATVILTDHTCYGADLPALLAAARGPVIDTRGLV
jgi:UDP-N-acetyl-D-mannosaminuronic acid dehydrogenase